MRIDYDALSDDPLGILEEVLTALKLDPGLAKSVEIPTEKLADAENLRWRERFLVES